MQTSIDLNILKKQQLKEMTCMKSQFISHRRSQRRIYPQFAILRINNVHSREAAKKYIGHAVELYKVYEGMKEESSVEGTIVRVHGNSGCVIAKFTRNLSPIEIGSTVYVKLYKSDDY
ncbi:60S ribosomal protein L35a [Dictyocoela muelleri]|nr:60S ribosomal protein L35a [Dictyocoela muelleri]